MQVDILAEIYKPHIRKLARMRSPLPIARYFSEGEPPDAPLEYDYDDTPNGIRYEKEISVEIPLFAFLCHRHFLYGYYGRMDDEEIIKKLANIPNLSLVKEIYKYHVF